MRTARTSSRRDGRWAAAAALVALACGGGADEPDAADGLDALEAPAAEAVEDEPAPPVDAPPDAPLVAFLGDSLAAGLHLRADQAFPAVVQRELADGGLPFRLVNAGVSGDTTAGGLSRLGWLLRQEPDVVVVELGANDGLRGLPVRVVEENLRAIVARAREGGARVLLLGIRLPPSLGEDYVRAFEEVYARVARDLDVPIVPHFLEGVGGHPELNLPDGIHPTAAGHRLLAQNVAPALAELLAPKGLVEREEAR